MARLAQPDPLPRELLSGVAWTFRGDVFADRVAFDAAVADYQNEGRKGWQPDAVVLDLPQVRISPDVCWYLTEEDPVLYLTADNGVAFTMGELLFKVHNALVPWLRQMDHQYFEGLSLADHRQEPGEPPWYDLQLGS